jgi:hypothetical protein
MAHLEEITEMWKRPALDSTSPKEVAEREHLFSGLRAVGIDPSEECPLCMVAFNSEDPATPAHHKTSSNNRLFACGCPGTQNKHVFHEYCLATACSQKLRQAGREGDIDHWDTTRAGVPCPLCRGLIGVRGVPTLKVMYPEVLKGGKSKTKKSKKKINKSRRKKRV